MQKVKRSFTSTKTPKLGKRTKQIPMNTTKFALRSKKKAKAKNQEEP
jgi:hypothetical protein